MIPWLLSLDRKLIYYSGGDENMPLISLKWLCTCWICYQIQEDAKKDFENELELGVFSLSTDGKGCLAQTVRKHWSFAHKIHVIPMLVFNSTCMVKLFTSGPACGLLPGWIYFKWCKRFRLCVEGSGGLLGLFCLDWWWKFCVYVVLTSSVQFGWWKQFCCPCSVLFTHVHIHTHTINMFRAMFCVNLCHCICLMVECTENRLQNVVLSTGSRFSSANTTTAVRSVVSLNSHVISELFSNCLKKRKRSCWQSAKKLFIESWEHPWHYLCFFKYIQYICTPSLICAILIILWQMWMVKDFSLVAFVCVLFCLVET